MATFQIKPKAKVEKAKQNTITLVTRLPGEKAEEFKRLATENNLSHSELLKQIVCHCLDSLEGSTSNVS